MIDIEFFPKVSNRSEHSVQGLERLLKWSTTNDKLRIRTNIYKQWLIENPNATPKEKSAMKVKYFPAVEFAGTFSGTGKSEDIKKMSGLIVMDFDHILNLSSIKQRLENDPHTFLSFISPSGDGLKIVVKHNLKEPSQWQYLFFELEAYYLSRFSLQVDKSGKDISRMCFLPFIDDLYKNDNSSTWHYTCDHEMQTKMRPKIESKPSIIDETDIDTIKECFYISAYLVEHKINIAEDYQDWLSYGYSLCALGEEGRAIFHNISCVSDKYDFDVCDQQFNYMLNHFDINRTNINNYLSNSKRAIAHHAIFTRYGFNCS